jgi:hypothetical protein
MSIAWMLSQGCDMSWMDCDYDEEEEFIEHEPDSEEEQSE